LWGGWGVAQAARDKAAAAISTARTLRMNILRSP
jgi:hypothetical protein